MDIVNASLRLPVRPSGYLLNHWAELTKLVIWLPLVIKVCESNIVFPPVFSSVWHTISKISKERGDFTMACHRLRNLGFNRTGFGLGYPYILETFTRIFAWRGRQIFMTFLIVFELKKKKTCRGNGNKQLDTVLFA